MLSISQVYRVVFYSDFSNTQHCEYTEFWHVTSWTQSRQTVLHFYSAFPVYWTLKAQMPHSPTHTHIHTLMAKAAMQGANCSWGAIWGSRTLQHGRARIQTSDPPITRRPALLTEIQQSESALIIYLIFSDKGEEMDVDFNSVTNAHHIRRVITNWDLNITPHFIQFLTDKCSKC